MWYIYLVAKIYIGGKEMKKFFALLLVMVMVISLSACGKSEKTQDKEKTPTTSENSGSKNNNESKPAETVKEEEVDFVKKGYKIAYILNTSSTDIFQMAVNGAKETAEALGMTCDVYFTDTDNVKFQDFVNTCANQGYDAMFLSHGNKETAYDLIKGLVEKGIKIVCFDTQLVDASGNSTGIDGVTQMFQDDQKLADLTLDYICNTIYADKVAAGEPVKILKIWRGPGISPFDRRQETYVKYEEQGLIETLEVLGPTDPANGEASMSQVIASALPKYPAGSIDAIWGCYDAYSRGAYVALMEAGRKEIPLVSVDISNQDINYMLDGNEIWRACSTVDFTTIGQQGIRILAMKLNGEETEAVYNLTPSLVTYDQLDGNANVLNLKDYVEGYGVNNDHISDWMKPYLNK
jgi:simple sugar transport system substrate-binding protein